MNFGPYLTANLRSCVLHVQVLLQSNFAKGSSCLSASIQTTLWIIAFLLFSHNFSIAQCTLSCVGSVNQPLPYSGTIDLSPAVFLSNGTCDPIDFTLNITDEFNTSYGYTVDCNNIGQNLTATVTEIASGLTCSSDLIVYDFVDPLINCTDTLILCTSSYDPFSLGFPTVSDNCSDLDSTDLSYTDNYIDLDCFTVANGDTVTAKVERLWTVADEYGNTDICLQTIYIKRSLLSEIVFPAHFDDFNLPVMDCNDDPYDLDVTGRPTVGGIEIDNADHCEFVMTPSDQLIDICGPGGFKVLRTWTVIDWCTNNFLVGVQIITVMDKTAPIISCPQDITVNTSTYDCSATVLLPTASAVDDCSAFSIEASWAFGTGTGPFFMVPEGDHIVTYTATDDCGNSSNCVISVSIIDNVPPVAICESFMEVDLTIDGTALIPAWVFDEGSHDNCGLDRFEVSRNGIDFDTTVQFLCEDVDPSPIMITLRVYDVFENYNECDIEVTVKDRIPPAIVCPSNIYLQCFDNIADTSLTGVPVYFDNCLIDTLYFEDTPNLNSCGVGSVLRTWTVVDQGQSSATCVQTIYVDDSTIVEVVFPPAFNSSVCNISTEPEVTGEPIISGNNCELVGISSTDEFFDISFPACYNIFRHWEVIDWCAYDPNSGSEEGRWTYTQVITITDADAPVLICPEDITISTNAFTCTGVFLQLDALQYFDCQTNVEITNDSPFADSNGANASGTYPIGFHNVTYTVSDGCGNESSCSFAIDVKDNVGPDMICENGLVVSLGNDATVDVWSDMILYSAWDNCSDSTALTYNLTASTFDCDDLGEQLVTLTVTDESGNSNFCTTTITVQDNLEVCPFIDLAGAIYTEEGEPCKDVFVNVTGGFNQTVVTNQIGNFYFPNLQEGANYSIVPQKDEFDNNGVNAFDLLLLSKHILNIEQIDSPYKRIAADVNGSGTISTLDMVYIRKLILFLDTTFAYVDSWQFVDADFIFNDSNPFDEAFPSSIFLNNQLTDELALDFVAIKSGDVNSSANPASIYSAESRESNGELVFKTDAKLFQASEQLELPFYCEKIQDITAYQFSLTYDTEALRYLDVEVTEYGKALGFTKELFATPKNGVGLITHVWNKTNEPSQYSKDALFIFHFETIKKGRLSEHLQINSELTKSMAFDKNGNEGTPILDFNNEQALSFKKGELNITAYPNPFVEKVILGFNLEKDSKLWIEVFDANGTLLFQKEEHFSQGRNQFAVRSEELGSDERLYLFRIRSSERVIGQGKLIKHHSN